APIVAGCGSDRARRRPRADPRPVTRYRDGPEARMAAGGAMGRGAPLLLVVDDDRKLVPLLERGLRYEGFEVACAYSGDEAVAVARAAEPDLVLLDVGMPGRDGFAVLRDLRRMSDVPVVMLTARDEVPDKVSALG